MKRPTPLALAIAGKAKGGGAMPQGGKGSPGKENKMKRDFIREYFQEAQATARAWALEKTNGKDVVVLTGRDYVTGNKVYIVAWNVCEN